MSRYTKLYQGMTALYLVGSLLGSGFVSSDAYSAEAKAQLQPKESRLVYGMKESPFVRKVLVALSEKGLDYKMMPTLPLKASLVNKKVPTQAFIQASPLGKIPAYQEGDWSIADSSVIIAYLDAQYDGHPLYPMDPKLKARTLWFEKYGDEVLAKVVHGKILFERVVKPKLFKSKTNEAIVQEALNKELPLILDYLETELGDRTWIAGDQFTAADIALVTHFIVLETLGEKVSEKKWPKLAAYFERAKTRDSFKQVLS